MLWTHFSVHSELLQPLKNIHMILPDYSQSIWVPEVAGAELALAEGPITSGPSASYYPHE